MKPRSRYIAHSSSMTHERSSERARASARRSRPGSYRSGGTFFRRARKRCHDSSTRGPIRSDSSASATSAVAASASSTSGGGLPTARRAREEDHPVGVPWDVLKRPDHPRLAATSRTGERHGRPQSGVQLAAKLFDQALLIGGDVDVSLRDQNFTMAWLHPQKLH